MKHYNCIYRIFVFITVLNCAYNNTNLPHWQSNRDQVRQNTSHPMLTSHASLSIAAERLACPCFQTSSSTQSMVCKLSWLTVIKFDT